MSVESVAQNVAKGIGVIAEIGSVESRIMPYATFIAGFFPGAASILAAIQIAQPFIDKAVAAAPLVQTAILDGVPIYEAIDNNAPQMIGHIKQAIAIFRNGDPSDPVGITADDISDGEAMKAASILTIGRPMTADEEEALFKRTKGDVGGF